MNASETMVITQLFLDVGVGKRQGQIALLVKSNLFFCKVMHYFGDIFVPLGRNIDLNEY